MNVTSWVVFPLVLAALCGGLGLLVDALCRRRLPGALIAPTGFAALVVLTQLASLAGAGIALIASALILLAGLGPLFSLPWRFGRPDPWPIAAALAAFALFAAPVLLSGHPTFAAYGDPADIGSWLARVDSDPIGAMGPLAVVQWLLGGEIAWYLQPYLAFLAALLSLCAWQLAALDFLGAGASKKSKAALGSRPRALIAFLAVIPALVFGYAGWISPFALGAGAWLALAIVVALSATVLALSLWIARSQPPAALAAFAAALLACAVFASAGASLAPYERLGELGEIDGRFAGQGPAILFEESPYADYFLGDLELAERRPSDPDRLDYRELLGYPLLVIPRSPSQSRPPLPFRRVYLGEAYEAWKLPRTATFRLLFHMPIGEPGAPVALPDCSQTVGLGLLALANQLGAAPQDITLIAAAPRRGDRLGPTVAAPVDRASDLCGRRWDWIEAIAPAG